MHTTGMHPGGGVASRCRSSFPYNLPKVTLNLPRTLTQLRPSWEYLRYRVWTTMTFGNTVCWGPPYVAYQKQFIRGSTSVRPEAESNPSVVKPMLSPHFYWCMHSQYSCLSLPVIWGGRRFARAPPPPHLKLRQKLSHIIVRRLLRKMLEAYYSIEYSVTFFSFTLRHSNHFNYCNIPLWYRAKVKSLGCYTSPKSLRWLSLAKLICESSATFLSPPPLKK